MKDFFVSRFQTISDYFGSQRLPTTDLTNIFSWSYWTESYLPSSSVYSAASLGAVILLLIILGIWRGVVKKRQQTLPVYQFEIDQLLSLSIFVGIMAISYAFFRSQQISYASSRLVVLVSIGVIVVWLAIIISHSVRVVPGLRSAHLEKERFFRYLPKKRK